MQFTLSSIMALALTLSVASAAPAPAMDKRWTYDLKVTFEGADPATTFDVPVILGQETSVGDQSRGHPDLSISYVSYDRYNYACTFTALHDGQGAATAAVACTAGADDCQLGPPQPVLTVTCVSCYGSPFCDGYPAL